MSSFPRSLAAVLLLIGTIVGVGMFAIPFVFVRAGFLTGLIELVTLTAVLTVVHLAYAEVVLRTPEIHRLPGYAARYLGAIAAWIARLSYLFGLSGALLVYLVLGGIFLGALLHAGIPRTPPILGPVAFYLIGALVVLRGIKFESAANGILTLGLIAALLLLGATLLPATNTSYLKAFDLSRLPVPYGVLLFALAGAAIIPDVRRALGNGEPRRMARVVVLGTFVSGALYLIFAVAIAGTTGEATTADAIGGIAERFGPMYGIWGSAIGFLATITSFIGLAVVLEGMFAADFGLKPSLATSLTLAIPPLLFAFGLHDFIAIIGLIGAVGVGIESILILLIHRRAQAAHPGAASFRIRIPEAVRVLIMVLFAAGIIVELVVSR